MVADHAGRRLDAIVSLRANNSEIFTTSPGWICDRLTLVPRLFYIPDVVPRAVKFVLCHMIQSTSPERSHLRGPLANVMADDDTFALRA